MTSPPSSPTTRAHSPRVLRCAFAAALLVLVGTMSDAQAQRGDLRRLPREREAFHSWADAGCYQYISQNYGTMSELDRDHRRMAMIDGPQYRAHGRYAYFQNPHEEVVPPPPGSEAPPGSSPNGRLPEGQVIGEEPEDYNVQFLRQQSVLLGHGDWQLDYGVVYSLTENDVPIALVDPANTVVGVTEGLQRNRLLVVPFEFRYGLRDHVQLSVSVPVGFSNSEIGFADFDEFESELGIGDVSMALSYVVCEGCRYKPDVIATFGVTSPTGNADFPLLTALTPNSVLGQGFWAASAQLLFIHTYDPVVMFYGCGYRHRFEASFLNPLLNVDQDVAPGEAVFYQLGTGFGVNEWITLSASFIGQYITEMEVDGDRIEGTILEPITMRFAVTLNTQHKLIEPFAEIGMTDSAVDARFGVVWTHTHRSGQCGCSYYK